MQQFISVEEAHALVAAGVEAAAARLGTEAVALPQALGRTLAEPVESAVAIPPFDNSAMDGYALRAADVSAAPTVLSLLEEIPAGTAPQRQVAPGTCSRIMTGAPLPAGADAVAPIEWAEEVAPDEIRIDRAPAAGQYVRRAGGDVAAGTCVFDRGTFVTPPVVGMLASVGRAEVAVRLRPRVAVVATGDELVAPGAPLGAGQIYDANGAALAAQAEAAGGQVLGPFHVADDPSAVRRLLARVESAEVLVFSGGVSVGRRDVVRAVLEAEGTDFRFWKVRQRPGKPLAFGVHRGRPVFGLPGNPVSSAVCFDQYVRPALTRMLGRQGRRPRQPALLSVAVKKAAGLHHFVRGEADVDGEGRLRVRPTGPQDSNLYSSFVRADVLIHLPEGMEDPEAGTPVEVEALRW